MPVLDRPMVNSSSKECWWLTEKDDQNNFGRAQKFLLLPMAPQAAAAEAAEENLEVSLSLSPLFHFG